MRKAEGNNEKRTLDIVDDYSEELERIINNPELLNTEEYSKELENSSRTHRHRYSSSHRHSSSRHHSSHSQGSGNYYDSYADDYYESGNGNYHNSGDYYSTGEDSYHHSEYSSRHRTGSGRLASHHRSRHHHHHHNENHDVAPEAYASSAVGSAISGIQNSGQSAYISSAEVVSEQTSPKGAPVSEEIEVYPVPENIQTIADKESYQGAKPAYINGNKVGKNNIEQPNGLNETPVPQGEYTADRTRRIASKASGSESSKREAERAESSGRRSRRRKSSRRRKKIGFFGVLFRILIVFLVIGVASVGTLLYLRASGEKSMKKPKEEVQIVIPREDPEVPEIEEVEDDGKTITYKGEKYRYNDNISTILFMGTDRTTEQQENSETAIGINGQADTIILCVIDNTNKKISFINVNRDTMTPVSEYTPDGDYAGDKEMQICLAYSYGADNKQSSERMVEAVSKFLYGMPINAYCRLSYDGIPVLNDAVGGVTVKIPEDMTSVIPEWTEGSHVTLRGEEAIRYVRWRDKTTVHTNELRMSRQKQYLKAFMRQTVNQVRADITLPLTLYSIAAGYMTTDITPSQVTYLSSKVLEYGIDEEAMFSIPGQSVDGEEHVEFYTDDKGLYEIILNTFYNKV